MQTQAVGIAWYLEEDYDRLRTMFTDGEKLPDTFHGWLTSAQGMYDHLAKQGAVVVKAFVDPEKFPAWCKAHGKTMDAQGRMHYASEYARNSATARAS